MTTKKKRPRTRRAPFTTLPGGAKLTFEGYLPSKACPSCHTVWPAAAYVKSLYVNQRRWLKFGAWCLQCDPPEEFPRDLHGVRPTNTYKDESNRIVGWQQRDRERGRFGPMLPLQLMGLRKTADGVWRPQPKLDRRSKQQRQEKPCPAKTYGAVCDTRRCFSVKELDAAIVHQKGLCKACGKPFTKSEPAVGGHNLSYADGGPTDPTNCIALHELCNEKMGRRSLTQYLRDQRLRDSGELFGDKSVES